MTSNFFKCLLILQYQLISGCHFFVKNEEIATKNPYVWFILLFPHYAKTNPLIKKHSQQTIIFEKFLHFFMVSSPEVCLTCFAYAFAVASISHNVSPDAFLFFNCERKMSIWAKKCVSLNLSLIHCFNPIGIVLCTHPGSSMLSSTLTYSSSLTPRVFFVSRAVFLTFFTVFGSCFWSCINLTRHKTEKGCPPLFVVFFDFFFHQRLGFHYHQP